MNNYLDAKIRLRALIAIIIGCIWYVALDYYEEPDSTWLDLVLNLLEEIPVVLIAVGMVLLTLATQRQHQEHLQVIKNLEAARLKGQGWRAEARSHLNGLGEAIDTQFSRWNMTEAEREVALLLLKGLSSKEIASVRNSSERTVREQARSVYLKAGLSGRTELSAYFLEDLLMPINVSSSDDHQSKRLNSF